MLDILKYILFETTPHFLTTSTYVQRQSSPVLRQHCYIMAAVHCKALDGADFPLELIF